MLDQVRMDGDEVPVFLQLRALVRENAERAAVREFRNEHELGIALRENGSRTLRQTSTIFYLSRNESLLNQSSASDFRFFL